MRGRSLANPRHACIVDLMLRYLINAGAARIQIAILCPYKAQLRVLKTAVDTGKKAALEAEMDIALDYYGMAFK